MLCVALLLQNSRAAAEAVRAFTDEQLDHLITATAEETA